MSNGLSDYQKKIKAQTIVENMSLDADLADLSAKLDVLFNDTEAEVRESVSKDELAGLIQAINQGTADNVKISRYLELVNKLGLSS